MKKLFAEKILDLGNIAIGALVFGYFINRNFLPASMMVFVGLLFFVLAYTLTFFLLKEEEI